LVARTPSSRSPAPAIVFGLIGVVAIPAGVAYSRYSTRFSLLDAAYVIPVAAVAAVAAILAVRGTKGHVQLGSRRSIRVAWVLAILAVCCTLSASIAVGFYELLLRLEH
jgi:4-hydroxybenzoate polyprenyltransferase